MTAVRDAMPPVAFITTVSADCVVRPASGRPVMFVATPEAGVPSAGVVSVGLVRVSPAIVVVVLPDAIEVDPIVIGNPLAPPPLPVPPNTSQPAPFDTTSTL